MRLLTFLDKLADLKASAYPVGAIYISAVPANPGELFGGTWAQIGKGRVLMGQGTVEANTTNAHGTTNASAYSITAGSLDSGAKGGTPDQINVAHTHTTAAHTHTIADHQHIMSGHTHTQEAHTHAPSGQPRYPVFSGTGSTETVGSISGSGNKMYQINKAGTWGYAEATTSAEPTINEATDTMSAAGGGETSSVNPTVQSAGSSGTNLNLPPFEVVYFYKRTA